MNVSYRSTDATPATSARATSSVFASRQAGSRQPQFGSLGEVLTVTGGIAAWEVGRRVFLNVFEDFLSKFNLVFLKNMTARQLEEGLILRNQYIQDQQLARMEPASRAVGGGAPSIADNQ